MANSVGCPTRFEQCLAIQYQPMCNVTESLIRELSEEMRQSTLMARGVLTEDVTKSMDLLSSYMENITLLKLQAIGFAMGDARSETIAYRMWLDTRAKIEAWYVEACAKSQALKSVSVRKLDSKTQM
jgi:hypothetical protein